MRYFKKFGDFCSGFSCFTILIYLFRQFMRFKPETALVEEVGMREKLAQFLSQEEQPEILLLLVLALMLAISVLGSAVLKRVPYLTLAFSLPPMLFALDLVIEDRIEDYPMLILLLVIITPITQLFECVRRDREDMGCRIGLAGDVICVCAAAFLLYLRKQAMLLKSLEDLDGVELNVFEEEIYRSLDTVRLEPLLWLAVAYLAFALISILMRDIYFIDLALSLAPLGVLIYQLNIGAISAHGEIIVTLALAVTVARAVATFGGRAKIKYKKRS